METFKIGDLRIIDPGETYLVKDSVLPLFYDPDEDRLFVVEEYEKGNPCEHDLNDLILDGVNIEQGISS